MTEKVEANGQCLCGFVCITVSGVPIRMAQCHCADCQRASGTGHACSVIFRAEDVTISGHTSYYATTADSGNVLRRHFCPGCGSRTHIISTGRPGMVILPIGLFEANNWFKPQVVLYTKKRPAWDMTSGDVPNYEGMPPAPAQSASR